MKKLLFLLMPLLFLGACNKKTISVDYKYNFATIKFKVDPTTAGVHALDQKTFTSNFDSFCVANNLDPNAINSVLISGANATLDDSTQNFDEFESARLYASTPNLPEIQIADVAHTPNGQPSLNNFNYSTQNLIDYLKSPEVTIRMEGTLRTDVTATKNVILKVEFKVNADIIQVK